MSIVILNLLVFFALVLLIAKQMRVGLSLSKQILLGLTLGVIFGLGLQLFYVENNMEDGREIQVLYDVYD